MKTKRPKLTGKERCSSCGERAADRARANNKCSCPDGQEAEWLDPEVWAGRTLSHLVTMALNEGRLRPFDLSGASPSALHELADVLQIFDSNAVDIVELLAYEHQKTMRAAAAAERGENKGKIVKAREERPKPKRDYEYKPDPFLEGILDRKEPK